MYQINTLLCDKWTDGGTDGRDKTMRVRFKPFSYVTLKDQKPTSQFLHSRQQINSVILHDLLLKSSSCYVSVELNETLSQFDVSNIVFIMTIELIIRLILLTYVFDNTHL